MSTDVTEEELIAGAVAPRVTKEALEANIATYSVVNAFQAIEALGQPAPESLKLLTIAFVTTKNGFTLVGESACASPENFDPDIGSRLALSDAKNKLWALMGYHLKQELYDASQVVNVDYRTRLVTERDELKARFEKLKAFLPTETFKSLADREQRLLVEQADSMGDYLAILETRLDS